jgi:hypothetical protein
MCRFIPALSVPETPETPHPFGLRLDCRQTGHDPDFRVVSGLPVIRPELEFSSGSGLNE